MDINADELFAAITAAAAAREALAMREAASEFGMLLTCSDDDEVQDVARRYIRLLQSDEFCAAPGAWHVVFAISLHIERLREPVIGETLRALLDAYPRFEEWMARFVVSELMEYFASDETLRVLNDTLANSNDAQLRLFLPHAFEHVHYGAETDELRSAALRGIDQLLNDPSEAVRGEACESLERIARRSSTPESPPCSPPR